MFFYFLFVIAANSSAWSPDSGVPSSPASSSGLTPHSDIHGQQYSPYSQNIYYQHVMTPETGRPYLEIAEEPCNMFRFRYQSEMHGTHGSLMGASSERSQKKFPTVILKGYNGTEAHIRCTLTQVERPGRLGPRRPHSHKLVIKKGASEECDPHIVTIKRETGFQAVFQGMGIIHTAKKDIPDELSPKMIRMEEYEKQRSLTGFEMDKVRRDAAEEAKNMNLNQVCLCFQAFGFEQGEWRELCEPVYSQTINNIKSALTGELKICRVSTTVSPVNGNQEVYLLVEKVNKGDIHVEFYEQQPGGQVTWRKNAKVLDVHHQYAIVIETPPYHQQDIQFPVDVWMELYRNKDGCRSKPWPFKYKPIDPSHPRKRARLDDTHESLPAFLCGSNYGGDGDRGVHAAEPEIHTTVDSEELMRILQELQNIPDLGQNLELDSTATGPSGQTAAGEEQLRTLPGYVFFKLALLLKLKHGTAPNTKNNLLKIFMIANKNRQK